ncbi:hypothetical protein D3C71_1572220 [compost metagenome]
MWERIARHAMVSFDGNPSVSVRRRNESLDFFVADQVLFRFKKGDSNGVSSNYPTQLALAFHDHANNLLGLPDVQRVDVVYRLNALETEIEDVMVVAREGERILWAESLLQAGDASNVVSILPDGPAPEESAGRRVVRPRQNNGTVKKVSGK